MKMERRKKETDNHKGIWVKTETRLKERLKAKWRREK